jgi:lipid-A-disaccharide synthase
MADFGAALGHLRDAVGPFDVVLPTLPHVEEEVRARAASWPGAPKIVLGEAAKYAAFRVARAALAASGTVTLELALAGIPLVGAYKVGIVEEQLKYLIKVPSILLPNLILGRRAIPEKLQRECTPAALAAELAALMRDGPGRAAQIEGLRRLDALMRLDDGAAPSAHAAKTVLETISARRSSGSAMRDASPINS